MSFLLQLNEALSKKVQKELMAEYRELTAEQTLYGDIAKKMASRISEIENQLMPLAKEAQGQKEIIDNAIVTYKMTSGRETVSYSDLWNETLKIVNEDQKKVLEAYKASITKMGEGKESLKIVDPKLQKILAEWNKDMTIDQLRVLIKKIAKLPDDNSMVAEGSVLQIVKDAIRDIVDAFKPVRQAQKTARASAEKLLAMSKKED